MAYTMHSAGCYHTPVFNADIRSGYSVGAFAFPSAAHLPFRFQHGSQLPHALCVRAYDFTSASMVYMDEIVVFYYTQLWRFVNTQFYLPLTSIQKHDNLMGCQPYAKHRFRQKRSGVV